MGGPYDGPTYLHPLLIVPSGDIQVVVTKIGDIDLEVRRPDGHAEVSFLDVRDGQMGVRARFHRAASAGAAKMVIRHRLAGTEHRFDAETHAEGGMLTWEVDVEQLIARLGDADAIWDLYVTQDGGSTLRLAGLLDDIAAKKRVVRFPAIMARRGGRCRVRPYYNKWNGMSLRVSPLGEDEAHTKSGEAR